MFLISSTQKQPEVFCKKIALKKFAVFTGKHLFQSVFFNKVAGWDLQLHYKRDLHRCFPVTFAKLLRTHFFNRTSSEASSVQHFLRNDLHCFQKSRIQYFQNQEEGAVARRHSRNTPIIFRQITLPNASSFILMIAGKLLA